MTGEWATGTVEKDFSALANADIDTTVKYGVLSCIECGSCAFVCPAKRPLTQTMRLAKANLRKETGK